MTKPSDHTTVHTLLRLRRSFSIFKRGSLWIGLGILALVVLGCAYQMIATEVDKRRFPPPGLLIDVDGHQMHIDCAGEGSPTVILEAGGFSFSSEWYWVQQELVSTQRVCAYDRAGNGWSEPALSPRSAQQIVDELHTLLEKANITGPYILVGHSFGGILNGVYAVQYPNEVKGIVLVDTAYANALRFHDENDYLQWRHANDLLNAPIWVLTWTGVSHLINSGAFAGYGYPPQIAARLAAFRSTNQAFDAYYAEGIASTWENQQPFASIQLGDQPLIVLWATILPRQLTREEQARLVAFQKEVAAYSSNSETRYIQGADHGSILGNELYARQVTEAIRDVIQAAQNGGNLAQHEGIRIWPH